MKEMKVKSEFKIHHEVVFLEKNVQNMRSQKYILSLGYDNLSPDGADPTQNALIFKIWDFISLDSK